MYSPPGLHRPCHSLHIPTNVWGAQDHESLVWSHVWSMFARELQEKSTPRSFLKCSVFRSLEGKLPAAVPRHLRHEIDLEEGTQTPSHICDTPILVEFPLRPLEVMVPTDERLIYVRNEAARRGEGGDLPRQNTVAIRVVVSGFM